MGWSWLFWACRCRVFSDVASLDTMGVLVPWQLTNATGPPPHSVGWTFPQNTTGTGTELPCLPDSCESSQPDLLCLSWAGEMPGGGSECGEQTFLYLWVAWVKWNRGLTLWPWCTSAPNSCDCSLCLETLSCFLYHSLTFKAQLDPAHSGRVPGCPAGSGDRVWSPARALTLPLTSCVVLGDLTVQNFDPFLYKIGVMVGEIN